MIRILITGSNSYIGTSFENWLSKWSDKYLVDTLDVRKTSWIKHNFTKYDVVLHVAAIVHVKEKDESLYYKINRDLAYSIAKKSKAAGIQQFIFLSTMGVYGLEKGLITDKTKENPKTVYAKSKLLAEKKIIDIKSNNFSVTILRPPLVYGKNCKGNYRKLSKLIDKLFFFPKCNNIRSMIYIDHLSEFIRLIIDGRNSGYFYPQNRDYVNVSELAYHIKSVKGKKIHLSFMLNFIKLFMFIPKVRKIFGNLVYSRSMYSDFEFRLIEQSSVFDLRETIEMTER